MAHQNSIRCSMPTPLHSWMEEATDQYIIETMANISAKPRWECNEATWVLQKACVKEWEKRYKASPMPTIVSEKEMVLTSSKTITFKSDF